jgi:hypothetical protein
MVAFTHEIHPIPRPRLLRAARFSCRRPCLRLLALSLQRVCPPPWAPQRFGSVGESDRQPGSAFFCSNRYSNIGCGRTFSVHWENVIPHCTLRTAQLLELIRARDVAPSTHAAWAATRLSISLTSAYRWLARWRRSHTRLLTWLGAITDPPRKSDGHPDPLHLRHLDAAFPSCPCPAAAFQNRFQIPIVA